MGGRGVEDKNPTLPAESAAEAPPASGVDAGDGKPTVNELLSAARGDVEHEKVVARPRPTPVPPSAKAASSNTIADAAPAADAPGKSVPSATPPAARVAPGSGASKAASSPTAGVNKGVSKAVAAKPPAAGPLVESISDPPINKLRRRVVWAVVAGIAGAFGLAFLRFFLPRSIFEPSTVFRIGFPGDYGVGVDTKLQQQYRIWVVKNTERLFVIYARCTHLGCTPDWKESENKFKCPCHGSGYDSEGVNFEGPAPRPMDRAQVTLDAEGQIVVNTGKLYEWQKGTEGQFNEEGAFIRV
jgi:cytochrome b6-f complex iron-sulfur subunit